MYIRTSIQRRRDWRCRWGAAICFPLRTTERTEETLTMQTAESAALSHGIETRSAFALAIFDEQTCFAKGVLFPATRLLDTLAVSRWSESMGSSLGCRGDLTGDLAFLGSQR